VPDGHAEGVDLPPDIVVMESRHPVPDERSVASADAALALVEQLRPRDLLLALVSGGGSSVLCKPAAGVTLADKQVLNERLQATGASIRSINRARQRVSAVKGGRLAKTSAAPVVTLVISDVPGNDPRLVASGPTVPASGTGTPGSRTWVVATGETMLQAARARLESLGYAVLDLGDRVEGEARTVAAYHAKIARRMAEGGRKSALLSGGETAVTLTGTDAGDGGRNTEYALALAIGLNGLANVWAIACDSDGMDGTGGQAGAVIGPDTLVRASGSGLDAAHYLETHDSAGYFKPLGDLVTTGPTYTNVNDFRAMLVEPPGA
jgi:glycerate 2-kinase